MKRRET